jgi:hypothetical protein
MDKRQKKSCKKKFFLSRNTNEKSLMGIKLKLYVDAMKPFPATTILFHFPLSVFTPCRVLLQTLIFIGADKMV